MNRFKRSVKYAVLLIFMIACSFSGIPSAGAAERQPQPVSVEQLMKRQSLKVSETAGQKANVTGSIQKGKKKIEQGGVQIVGGGESDEQSYVYTADIKKGKFSLYLPDGSYTVEGYWDETGMFISCEYSFTVVKGKSNPSPLKIVIPADNVKGYIQKAGKKVSSGFLFISNEKEEDSHFAEIKNGQFNLYLPDGSYVVDGYIDDAGAFVSVKYSFTVSKGKSNPSPLKIVLPADNVKGSIQKAGKKVSSGFLFISGEGGKEGEEEDSYFVEIKNGQFSLYLPDGSYKVEGYTDDAKSFVSLQYSFTVAEGKSNPSPLKIVIPADNVKGSIQKAGKKVSSGSVTIRDINSKEDSYYAEIKNGQFSLYLLDGSYVVEEYSDDEGNFVPLQYSFTVEKGKSNPSPLKITIPADNVKGSVQKAGKKVASGSVTIRDINSKEDSYYAKIKNSQFSLYLPDGSYVVEEYSDDEGNSVPLQYSFTVAKGKSNPSPLKITVPADNVKGSVQKAGKKVTAGTVVISDTNTKEDVYYTKIQGGQFSIYLLDGTYEVVEYIDSVSEEWAPLKYAFTVKNGKSNPSILKVEIPETK